MREETGPWVVKVGGREIAPGSALAGFALTIRRAVRRGRQVVVVHGGGDEVGARQKELGIPVVQVDGQRVTNDETLEVVAEVLAGRVNVRLVNALEAGGVRALGLSGVSTGLLRVKPAAGLGWVGEPTGASAELLHLLLNDGITPVIAPLGSDGSGGVYNVNADLAAAAIAAALHAELYLLTDVEGVMTPRGETLRLLPTAQIAGLIGDGTVRAGMIPKLTATERALARGAHGAWLGTLEKFTEHGPSPGAGTRIVHQRSPPAPAPVPSQAPTALRVIPRRSA
ncbi:MAG: acetylglutamate kinase [Thermoplasmata archaeon]|nr:acetylglutamate kinase [Thermoplasmata archaeon]